jgi:hypothetical protein
MTGFVGSDGGLHAAKQIRAVSSNSGLKSLFIGMFYLCLMQRYSSSKNKTGFQFVFEA